MNNTEWRCSTCKRGVLPSYSSCRTCGTIRQSAWRQEEIEREAQRLGQRLVAMVHPEQARQDAIARRLIDSLEFDIDL